MEQEKKYLSDRDLAELLLRQERLLNKKYELDLMKMKAESIKLTQQLKELEAEKIGWSHDKQVQAIRSAKESFKNKRESYLSFLATMSKKYDADFKHGFCDETGEILTGES